jgi:lysophospholipase L1-like esterase
MKRDSSFPLIVIGLLTCIGGALHAGEIKIACVGNSITEGYGVDGDENYPARLQSMLGDSFTVGNFGEAGCCVIKEGIDPYWGTGPYWSLLSFEADIVVILLGTVDTKDGNWQHEGDFTDDYTALIDTLTARAPVERFFLCLPPPITQPLNTMDDQTLRSGVIPKIEQIAAAGGHVLVDLYAAMESHDEYYQGDGVHPDARGAEVIAEAIHAAIVAQQQTGIARRLSPVSPGVAEETGLLRSERYFTVTGRRITAGRGVSVDAATKALLFTIPEPAARQKRR